MQFVGIPSETLYWILLTVWPISGLVVFCPRTEELLARWFHRFRPPSALEMQRIGPAWWACAPRPGSTRTGSECGSMRDRRRQR